MGGAPLITLEQIESSLRASVELEGAILQAGTRIREQSKTAYGHDLLDA